MTSRLASRHARHHTNHGYPATDQPRTSPPFITTKIPANLRIPIQYQTRPSPANMPTTRRKATGTPASRSKTKAAANQAKLTFHGRVSKPGVASDTPEKKAAALKADKLESPAPEAADIHVEEDTQQTTSADSSLLEDEEAVEAVVDDAPVDPDEALAREVDEDRIKSYWEEKEEVMGAPRVHLKEPSLHEKLLRQWDIDNRYGVSFFFEIYPAYFNTCNCYILT